jgi:hypothetical protein
LAVIAANFVRGEAGLPRRPAPQSRQYLGSRFGDHEFVIAEPNRSSAMNARPLVLIALIAVGLAGCHKTAPEDAAVADNDQPGFLGLGSHHGRYGAVGIYTPSQPWTRMVTQLSQNNPGAAQLADDQAVIVVSDSQTGEVRACGDLTGYCISMNPWKAALVGGQLAPIKLKPEPVDQSAQAGHTGRMVRLKREAAASDAAMAPPAASDRP